MRNRRSLTLLVGTLTAPAFLLAGIWVGHLVAWKWLRWWPSASGFGPYLQPHLGIGLIGTGMLLVFPLLFLLTLPQGRSGWNEFWIVCAILSICSAAAGVIWGTLCRQVGRPIMTLQPDHYSWHHWRLLLGFLAISFLAIFAIYRSLARRPHEPLALRVFGLSCLIPSVCGTAGAFLIALDGYVRDLMVGCGGDNCPIDAPTVLLHGPLMGTLLSSVSVGLYSKLLQTNREHESSRQP